MYINESLGIYPRFDGDIQIIDPTWQPGLPLPEGWEEVTPTEMPVCGPSQIAEELAPEKINGVWHRKWQVRNLTEEEIETARLLQEEMIREMNVFGK